MSRSEPVSPCLPQSLQTAALQDLNYCNTGVEPRVAVDPRTVSGGRPVIIGVWQQDRFQNGGASALMAASSRDGGRTWDRTCLPFTLCVSRGIRAEAASDPLVSIGPDGTAYATGLILSVTRLNRSQGVVVATSRDGGTSWGNVQAIVRDSLTQLSDKESVTADPVHAGVAYVIWDRTGLAGGRFSQPPWFSRTMDHGRHWSTPRPIPGVPGLTIGHQIVVDPRTDTLYDVFSRVNQSKHEFCQPEREDCANPPSDSDIALIRSTDMGLTWSAPAVIARNRAVGPGKGLGIQVRVGTRVPEAALDPVTGRLYVVFEDAGAAGGRYDAIALVASDDGGRHWTYRTAVPSPPGTPAVTPSLAVSSDGRIGITYYTMRWRTPAQTYLETEFWFVSGSAGGTFLNLPVRLAGPFNLLDAPWADGFFLGDYEGLAGTGNGFVSLFAVANAGRPVNRTEVLSARITR